MYGNGDNDYRFAPVSPYGASKLAAHNLCGVYRDSYNLFISCGILFNHESERRGNTFVTKKITRAAANIVLGNQQVVRLGNLNAKRDWGYAPEYCEGMWRILQQETAEDFVLATGETHTVREFAEHAFKNLGITIEWKGSDADEKGFVAELDNSIIESFTNPFDLHRSLKVGDLVVEVSKNYYRPTEVELLIGNPTKAKEKLGWEAETKFEKLVKIMQQHDFIKLNK